MKIQNVKLKKILKAVWDNLILRWAIALLVATYSLDFIIDSFITFILPELKKIMISKIDIPHQEYYWYEILLTLFSLLFLFFIFKRIKNKFKRNFYFIKENGMKWKVNKKTGNVAYYPFCKKHGIELKEISGPTRNDPYYMSCALGHKITNYSKYDIEVIRDKVSKIAIAKINGHY